MAMTANFVEEIIAKDLAAKKYGTRVVTRFPPEPNGYPHIGHAKSICLNFGAAKKYGGVCHLRMDDTDPTTEDMEYVQAIKRDVKWLGFDWGDKMFYASDYFQALYDIALRFVREGKAYVCSLNEEDIRTYRGTVNEAGKPSPYRERSVDENLKLLDGMRVGEFAEGAHTLRAKADMANPNMKMRDPLMYRIRKAHHYRAGDKWNIYPMYDFAHCFSDAFEGVTHSLCTLEFENNRELYDWFLHQAHWLPKQTGFEALPEQIEFARLVLDYTVVSKRKLLELVKNGHVKGWDDPRMPTLSAMRRRGYTPESLRAFCEMIGVAKANSNVDIGKLEFCVREDLNLRSPRVLCVLDPLPVLITNWVEGKVENIDAPFFPKEFNLPGSRDVPMSKKIFIERSDFMEKPSKDFQRLSPGAEVRLRFGYAIKCKDVIKDTAGNVTALHCTYDPDSAHGKTADGRKVKSILHWVSAAESLPVEVRLYDRLFSHPRPEEGEAHFTTHLNPESLKVAANARIEPSAASAKVAEHFQFERLGFFFVDSDSRPGALVFNRAVTLKDTWTKAEEAPAKAKPQMEKGTPQKAAAVSVEGEAFAKRHVLPVDQAERLVQHPAAMAFFEAAVASGAAAKAVAPWVVNELLADLKEGTPKFSGAELGALVSLVESGSISRRAGKDVLEHMRSEGGAPAAIVKKLGLEQVNDTGALEVMVREVLAKHPEQVTRYKGGEEKLFGFLVGQVIKSSGGKANPKTANELVKKLI